MMMLERATLKIVISWTSLYYVIRSSGGGYTSYF